MNVSILTVSVEFSRGGSETSIVYLKLFPYLQHQECTVIDGCVPSLAAVTSISPSLISRILS